MTAASAPWVLLAGGIGLIILGYFLATLGSRGSGRTYIHAKMSDDDIARTLNENQGNPLANLVTLAGLLAIFISVVWRLVRMFV